MFCILSLKKEHFSKNSQFGITVLFAYQSLIYVKMLPQTYLVAPKWQPYVPSFYRIALLVGWVASVLFEKIAVSADIKNFRQIILQIAIFPTGFFRITSGRAVFRIFAFHYFPAGTTIFFHHTCFHKNKFVKSALWR